MRHPRYMFVSRQCVSNRVLGSKFLSDAGPPIIPRVSLGLCEQHCEVPHVVHRAGDRRNLGKLSVPIRNHNWSSCASISQLRTFDESSHTQPLPRTVCKNASGSTKSYCVSGSPLQSTARSFALFIGMPLSSSWCEFMSESRREGRGRGWCLIQRLQH